MLPMFRRPTHPSQRCLSLASLLVFAAGCTLTHKGASGDSANPNLDVLSDQVIVDRLDVFTDLGLDVPPPTDLVVQDIVPDIVVQRDVPPALDTPDVPDVPIVPDIPLLPDVPDVPVVMDVIDEPSCGGLNQPCCAANSCSSTTLVCVRPVMAASACVTCGGAGQPCCNGTTCNTTTPGLTCTQDTVNFAPLCVLTQMTGGPGAICSNSNDCGGSRRCRGFGAQAGWCVECGNLNESCCGGNACNSNRTCTNTSAICQ